MPVNRTIFGGPLQQQPTTTPTTSPTPATTTTGINSGSNTQTGFSTIGTPRTTPMSGMQTQPQSPVNQATNQLGSNVGTPATSTTPVNSNLNAPPIPTTQTNNLAQAGTNNAYTGVQVPNAGSWNPYQQVYTGPAGTAGDALAGINANGTPVNSGGWPGAGQTAPGTAGAATGQLGQGTLGGGANSRQSMQDSPAWQQAYAQALSQNGGDERDARYQALMAFQDAQHQANMMPSYPAGKQSQVNGAQWVPGAPMPPSGDPTHPFKGVSLQAQDQYFWQLAQASQQYAAQAAANPAVLQQAANLYRGLNYQQQAQFLSQNHGLMNLFQQNGIISPNDINNLFAGNGQGYLYGPPGSYETTAQQAARINGGVIPNNTDKSNWNDAIHSYMVNGKPSTELQTGWALGGVQNGPGTPPPPPTTAPAPPPVVTHTPGVATAQLGNAVYNPGTNQQ